LIRSVGLDIVDVNRVRTDIEKYKERFIKRILGDREIVLLTDRVDKEIFLAGRLAAKEAVIKGLNPYMAERPAFTAVQIINDDSGQPHLVLPHQIQMKLGRARCFLSLTHDKSYAAAVAIFEED
jgi:holo-[acyl-carrier protein] synthase